MRCHGGCVTQAGRLSEGGAYPNLLARLAFALRDRLTGKRAEPFHDHGILRETQDRVIGYLTMGDQVLRGGGEEYFQGCSSSPHANDLAWTDNEKKTKKIWNERSNRHQAV